MTSTAAIETLERWLALDAIGPLDAEIGRLLLDLDAQSDARLPLAAALTSRALSEGHSCLSLAALLARMQPQEEPAAGPSQDESRALRQVLEASDLVAAGDASQVPPACPLVLDGSDRLYLRRYFRYEQQVAWLLRARCIGQPVCDDPARVRAVLERHFRLGGQVPDWQAVAVLAGLSSPLAVITGGPGTGKTSTVLWLLACHLQLALEAGGPLPRIALAAPTGKAATRLGDSLRARKAALDVAEAVREAIPDTPATVHRLLGTLPGSSGYRHHAGHPIEADIVIVDEASMIDLPLMAHLLDALDAHTRLVLLGDRNQLASVEAGNVLAAICRAAGEQGMSPARSASLAELAGFEVPASAQAGAFADHVVELRESWRFDSGSGLGRLASEVMAGQADRVIEGLRDGRFKDVEWRAGEMPARALVQSLGEHFAGLAEAADAAEALALSNRHGVLTALREGPHGCEMINEQLERVLRQRAGVGLHDPWYRGRLLMIRENDYAHELFNGDIGIVWPDDEGRLGACFPAADGVRRLPLSSLPAHASAWAVTIHKSQGSEFDRVSIVLPQGSARVLGRELLYTAITRARQAVTILGGETALRHAVGHSTRRESGLADMLMAGTGPD